jgi:Zn-finger nucleic acid-binding protein
MIWQHKKIEREVEVTMAPRKRLFIVLFDDICIQKILNKQKIASKVPLKESESEHEREREEFAFI